MQWDVQPPRPPERRSSRTEAEEDMAALLATWTTVKLRREHWQYKLLGTLSMVLTPACIVAGVWVDWRWLAMALLALVGLGVTGKVNRGVHLELVRREDAELADAVGVIAGRLPADDTDDGPVAVPASVLRTVVERVKVS